MRGARRPVVRILAEEGRADGRTWRRRSRSPLSRVRRKARAGARTLMMVFSPTCVSLRKAIFPGPTIIEG